MALLNLMLPGTDGIELMRDILEMTDVPAIFLGVQEAFDSGHRIVSITQSGSACLYRGAAKIMEAGWGGAV